MGELDPSRSGLLTCAEVRERMYPFLLLTVSERERLEIVLHTETCASCRLTLEAVSGRLKRIDGVPVAELGARPVARRARRRLWLALLPALPAAIAYALLIQQGIQMARYRYEQKFLDRVQRAIHAYHADFGEYPPDDGAALAVLLSTTARGAPYLDLGRERLDSSGRFLDHWGNAWVYRAPGRHNPRMFDVQSYGSNGRDDSGKGDDIANWDG